MKLGTLSPIEIMEQNSNGPYDIKKISWEKM
jgi:hypothetical protein